MARCLLLTRSAQGADALPQAPPVALPNPGPFSEVTSGGRLGPDTPWPAPLEIAAELEPDDWVFVVAPGETPAPDALAHLAALPPTYDVLFGAMALPSNKSADGWQTAKPTRLAADTRLMFSHALLHWWLGASVLVRAGAQPRLAAMQLDQDAPLAAFANDFEASELRALKTNVALTRSDAAELLVVPEAERLATLENLAIDPPTMQCPKRGWGQQLLYTGINPTIERVQMRGQFFEEAELRAAARFLKPGDHVVDVGANTGNHTVWFAGVCGAHVTALEPVPETAALLERVVALNGLADRVSTRHLRIAVGETTEQARIERGRRGHLGTARIVPDAAGPVPVRPLDALIQDPVKLLKIDVEDLEIEVLRGARELIARHRPALFVEVQDANAHAFADLMSQWTYGVVDAFPEPGYCNYILTDRGDGHA